MAEAKALYQASLAGVKLAGKDIKKGSRQKEEFTTKMKDEDRHIQALEVTVREEEKKTEELEKLKEELEPEKDETTKRRSCLAKAE